MVPLRRQPDAQESRKLSCRETEFPDDHGDGVGDVNINELIEFHRLYNPIATMTVVQTVPRYGLVKSIICKFVYGKA